MERLTNNLLRRVYEHQNNLVEGFTQKYNIHILVFYQFFESIDDAITYEKRLKKWKREWKIELIESKNREWKDLCKELI